MGGTLVAYRQGLALILGGLCALGLPAAAAAQESPATSSAVPPARPAGFAPGAEPAEAHDLFAMPEIAAALQRVAVAVEAGDLAAAAAIVEALAAAHPTVGLLAASRAALHMLAGEPEAAVAALEAAAARGFAELPLLMADPLFAAVARDPRLAGLAPAAPPAPPVPAPLAAGVARVDGTNTLWDPARGWLVARFGPPPQEDARVLGRQGGDAAYDRLRDLHRLGRAAGNSGDLYDNRDRGHSALRTENHPQVIPIRYGEAARAWDVDYGLNDRILFDRPTFGNSSTALTSGPLWRSLPRAALTRADGAGPWRLWEAYVANQIYVYPSHKDVTAERGDLLPANTPYMIVAEGSSGADQPFLEAVAMILASFRPATKARLVEEELLAPTVQFVFRRSQRSVLSREDYFSGLAHPSAFAFHEIGLARMVSLANAIAPDAIPPLVRLEVVEEDAAVEGVDFFGAGLSEQLFDTPSAIARVWRSKAHTRRMTVSAAATRDPNGRPLAFHWRLLRGDPERVRITPLGDGARAEIAIDWQGPRPVADESPVVSSRVDVGVFASNGAHDSAPAFVSVLLPAHETRVYAPGPDGTPRIAAIDHADPRSAGAYLDPMLLARADWRDDYRYDTGGRLAGWRRTRDGRPAEDFDAEGRRILDRDAAGRPRTTAALAYPLARGPEGGLVVEEAPASASGD